MSNIDENTFTSSTLLSDVSDDNYEDPDPVTHHSDTETELTEDNDGKKDNDGDYKRFA